MDIDELIQSIDPVAKRKALQEKKTTVEQMLAVAVVEYELERDNPNWANPDQKQAIVDELQTRITTLGWARKTIDEKLDDLPQVIGLNRAARRNGSE